MFFMKVSFLLFGRTLLIYTFNRRVHLNVSDFLPKDKHKHTHTHPHTHTVFLELEILMTHVNFHPNQDSRSVADMKENT